jgi:hypothetical protein
VTLGEHISTNHPFYLLLWTLHCFKTNGFDKLDSLIENLQQRSSNIALEDRSFLIESFPLVIVFLLLISFPVRRS